MMTLSQMQSVPRLVLAGGLLVALSRAPAAVFGDEPTITFRQTADRLDISAGGEPLATYVFDDAEILRPYFCHLHASGGLQVTRNHPPVEGVDATDHAAFHPGVWLAFGELAGADFWRNRGCIRHVEFTEQPRGRPGFGSFAVRNRYEHADRVICEEKCRMTILLRPVGHLLLWDSTFSSEAGALTFGDQEEMGLGVRLATPLSVARGGQIINSDGLVNEAHVWGQQADWCAYFGQVDGRPAGIALMPHPQNFGRCWFHARDYGLLVANPFGRNAFTKGDRSRITVPRGQELRLRFGVLAFHAEAGILPDLPAAYRDYLEQAGSSE